jgi:Rrf2 family protein
VISRTSEYAIRALAYLGTLKTRDWKLSRDIAEELGMPSPFLGKVLQTMAAVGIVESQRGRGGGFRLLRPARMVSLYEIVEPIDHLGDRRMCVLGQKLCGDEHACPLHEPWKRSRETFLAALRKTTLADVERAEFPGSVPWNVKPTRAKRARRSARSA